MFSRTVRYQLPFKSINTSRPFITSTFVCNHKKEESGQKKEGSHKKEEEKKQDNNKYKENGVCMNDLHLPNLQASYLLSLADQENLRQRATREVANAKDFGIQKFAKDLLDSLDILGMALQSVPEEFRSKEACMQKDSKELAEQLTHLYTGVSMTESVLQKTLKRHDIEIDNPLDQEFDPNKHEAVFQTPIPDKQPGTIFTVQKVGYTLKNRILRPAQVGVVAET
ncbi:GrpE-domain-containing protein [Mucor mucedo]|uniref:GrpE-domain-containing protein n=1 Tax=Mucor mucedo TaxID=29922 RepID=UPI00221EBE50|nr:GrpE-domain-containing protein [Mucor mucedo]KAI7896868.1 GrpE-domain-containing protein [Mucor mucedo]